jgi:hypothetical protein
LFEVPFFFSTTINLLPLEQKHELQVNLVAGCRYFTLSGIDRKDERVVNSFMGRLIRQPQRMLPQAWKRTSTRRKKTVSAGLERGRDDTPAKPAREKILPHFSKRLYP